MAAGIGGSRTFHFRSRERFLLQPDFLCGIAVLEEFDLAYDILIYARHLPLAAEFVAKFPRHRFVLDHLGKPPIMSGAIDDWARNTEAGGISECLLQSVWPGDRSGLAGLEARGLWPYLDVAFECFGPSRLMIGSDWPVCMVAGSYSRVVDVVKDYVRKFSAEEREAVLGGNAATFWRLKRP